MQEHLDTLMELNSIARAYNILNKLIDERKPNKSEQRTYFASVKYGFNLLTTRPRKSKEQKEQKVQKRIKKTPLLQQPDLIGDLFKNGHESKYIQHLYTVIDHYNQKHLTEFGQVFNQKQTALQLYSVLQQLINTRDTLIGLNQLILTGFPVDRSYLYIFTQCAELRFLQQYQLEYNGLRVMQLKKQTKVSVQQYQQQCKYIELGIQENEQFQPLEYNPIVKLLYKKSTTIAQQFMKSFYHTNV